MLQYSLSAVAFGAKDKYIHNCGILGRQEIRLKC